jgi:hypothetical protein
MTEKPKDKKQATSRGSQDGWGIEKLPYPTGVALIQTRWDLCTGLWDLRDGLQHETFWGDPP